MAVGITDVRTIFALTSALASSFTRFLARSMAFSNLFGMMVCLRFFCCNAFQPQDQLHPAEDPIYGQERNSPTIVSIQDSLFYRVPKPKIW